jgi:hypothetical protein
MFRRQAAVRLAQLADVTARWPVRIRGRPAFVSVSAGGRGAVEELWHALVAAGARREQD